MKKMNIISDIFKIRNRITSLKIKEEGFIRMKNSKSVVVLFALTGALLVGCGQNGSSNVATSSLDPILTPTIDTSSTAGYAAGRHVFDNFMAADKEWNAEAFSDKGMSFMPSHGRTKLLVVPVVFSDNASSAEDLEANRECMQKAFFGKAEETTWQSVQSYYYASSYHQLHIEGEVAKTIKTDKTFSDYSTSKVKTVVNGLIEELFDKLFTADGAQYQGKQSDWDSNGDGIIDGIYFVSDNEISASTDLGWAFTTHHYFATARLKASGARYSAIGTYCWTSIKFATRVASERASILLPDSHTFIHEMGHQLGLNDYYDPKTQASEKAGGSTMQDENVGDHDGYSKYLWGWTSPQVVTDKNSEKTLSITLRPSESSGDGLILTSGFNGTALDEYLYIEYYTPTGLNAHDAAKSYESSDQQCVKTPGIRVWHVDKNINEGHMGTTKNDSGQTVPTVYFDPNPVAEVTTNGADQDYTFPEDIDTADDSLYNSDQTQNMDDDFYTTFTTNNSTNYSTDNFYLSPELQIVRAANTKASAVMTSESLFTAGSTFGTASDVGASFSFYSPATTLDYNCAASDWHNAKKIALPYSFEVTALTDEAATLTHYV
jgi:M6 family metalloprotease-like protein